MAGSNADAPALQANGSSNNLASGDIRESIEEEALNVQPATQVHHAVHASQSNGATLYANPYTNGALPSPAAEDDYDSYGASAIEPASSGIDSEEQPIHAYAKLEFADGDFYMTTHAVELGREKPESPRPSRGGWDADRRGSKNPSTEEGGPGRSKNDYQVTGGDAESGMEESRSTATSSQQEPRHTPTRGGKMDYNALAFVPPRDLEFQANDVNMDEFDLSHPVDCPLIPLQQPRKSGGVSVNKKSISRRHARICFNCEKHYFELLFLGRNGGFLDDEWFAAGDIQPLVNGSVIQIGGLGLRFVLPDVPPGETGASEVEDEISLDGSVEEDSAEDEEVEEEEEAPADEDAEEVKMTTRGRGRVKAKPEPKPEPKPAKTKRKKPGRPPKNGIMSKRCVQSTASFSYCGTIQPNRNMFERGLLSVWQVWTTIC